MVKVDGPPRPPRSGKKKDWQWQYGIWLGGTAFSVLFACAAVLVSPEQGLLETLVNDQSVIDHVNLNARTWRAGAARFFEGWRLGEMQRLGGISVSQANGIPDCMLPASVELPKSFDARKKWPACFAHVYDMGNCSASWAIAVAGALSKRFCIASPKDYGGLRLSPQQLLSCEPLSRGCGGGALDTVFGYLKNKGLVSEPCFPYQADDSVACSLCEEEPKRLASVCRVANLRQEIFLNGPVVAPVLLLNDFLVYRSGIYQETRTASPLVDRDRQRQLQAVTVLGWGVSEASVEYWIIENAWGQDWGENGYAKIAVGDVPKKRGILLEEFVFAGTPLNPKVLFG
ncbi:CP2 [Symbiodinium sp. CCMP2456]|nr:CP2 [Symbiodinium sp. CCMP2456]